MFVNVPELKVGMIGKQSQLDWFERIILSHEHWHRPHLITGTAGIGKTTAIGHFLAVLRTRVDALWADMARTDNIDQFLAEFDERISSKTGRSKDRISPGKFVVLDNVDPHSDDVIQTLVNRIANYKRVHAIVLTCRRKPAVEFASVLTLAPFRFAESYAFLQREIKVEVAPDIVDQMIIRSSGHPVVLKLMAAALNQGGLAGLNAFWNTPIYDLGSALSEKKIIEEVHPKIVFVSGELLAALKREPESIFDLTSRQFEELLAELLHSLGAEVELTPTIKDGGNDIIARLQTAVGKVMCLVEAKHYRKDRKVGVELVRQLHGVLHDQNVATCAMLVTTSSFTKGAMDFQARHEYTMTLRGYSDVVGWIEGYKQDPKSGLFLPPS